MSILSKERREKNSRNIYKQEISTLITMITKKRKSFKTNQELQLEQLIRKNIKTFTTENLNSHIKATFKNKSNLTNFEN